LTFKLIPDVTELALEKSTTDNTKQKDYKLAPLNHKIVFLVRKTLWVKPWKKWRKDSFSEPS
jgi:hypothetical protein